MVEEVDRRSDPNWDGGMPTIVFRTWERTEAEVIKALLEGQGITCMVSSDISHTIYPFSVDGLGEIRIYVPEEKADEARELIAAYSEDKAEPDDGSTESE